jgi:hypothetical protein
MATSRTSYGKLQRDRVKKEKADAKRARRIDKTDEDGDDLASRDITLDPAALLAQVEELHRQFEDDEIDFDEFEDRKIDLMAQLMVD